MKIINNLRRNAIFTISCLFLIPLILTLSCNFQNQSQDSINDPSCEYSKNLHLGNSKVSFEEWYITWGYKGIGDHLSDVAIDSSDNIYVIGISDDENNDRLNASFCKFNSSGDLQWKIEIQESGSFNDPYYKALCIDSSDFIFITGYYRNFTTNSFDIWLLKYNNSGSLIWNTTWGDTSNEQVFDIEVDNQGNIYVSGLTDGHGVDNYGMLLLKFNSSGDFEWYRTWDTSKDEIGWGIAINNSTGDIYMVGDIREFPSDYSDAIIVCFNRSGSKLWNKTWDNGVNDGAYKVMLDSHGDMYLAGGTRKNVSSTYDILILKCDSLGNEIWHKTWGEGGSTYFGGLIIDSLNNIYITGGNESMDGYYMDVFVLKYNSSGHLQWDLIWGGESSDKGMSIDLDSFNNIYIAGFTSSFDDSEGDFLLLKCSSSLDLTPPNITNIQVSNDPLLQGNIQTITSNVSDVSNISEVISFIEHPDENTVLTLELFDDGLHSDGNPNDGIYGNAFSSAGFDPGTYFVDIKAVDNSTFHNVQNINNGVIFTIEGIPIITIHLPPANATYSGTAVPYYNLSITGTFDTVWYTIDNGITNITMSSLYGIISQEEWDKKPNGTVTIIFYANNSFGMIGTNQVQVIKSVSDQESSTISGYQLITLLGVSFMISLIIVNKRIKK